MNMLYSPLFLIVLLRPTAGAQAGNGCGTGASLCGREKVFSTPTRFPCPQIPRPFFFTALPHAMRHGDIILQEPTP